MAAELDGAELFKTRTCTTCHGKDGNTPIVANYPSIGGQSKEYILQQLMDIKSGARSNGQSAAMQAIMHLVSDEEIDVIADYVSTLGYEPGRAVSKVAEQAPEAEQSGTASPAEGDVDNKMTGDGGEDS
ncbi:MAG: c-type cytochrome, partial [Methylococcales bacterium]|nr:c-type cytochrome [Methylococcales bacterium]